MGTWLTMPESFTTYELHPLRPLAAAIKEEWDIGAEPDACAAFEHNPDLLADKTIFLDLAYEGYCRLRERGEVVNPKEYCCASLAITLICSR